MLNLGVLWRPASRKEVAICWYEYPINPIKPWAGMSHAASAIMDDADAAAEEFATVLAGKLEADIPPIAEFDAAEDPQRGDDNL